MITTRQKSNSDNLKELQHLRDEIQALRQNNVASSNYGVISFIFVCSLILTWAQENQYIMQETASYAKKAGLNYNFDDFNMLDKSIITSIYHYVIYKAISNRFFVSVAFGISLMFAIPGAYHDYFVGS